MTESKDSNRNFIGGSGNITTGTFTNSQVASVSGSQNVATVYVSGTSVAQDPWGSLEKELARIRRQLEEDRSNSISVTDRDDAVEAVEAAQATLPATDRTNPEVQRNMRRCIKSLIGILTPVTQVIGGVAGLEAIWPHL